MAIETPAEDKPEGAPDWMVTFADMMSLLLTFFVLLLSFSTIEIVAFKAMSGSMKDAFGLKSEFDIMDTPMGAQVLPKPAPAYTKNPVESPTQVMTVKLRDALEKAEMKDQGNVEVTERGVTLRLEGDAIFDSGQTDLKQGSLELLDALMQIALDSPGTIEVEGHTDDVPIRSSRFPSNWELSAARAGSAVRYLSAKGLPALRRKAIGYADTRPLVPNDSAENRAKNRRVEFLFVSEKEGQDA